MNSVLNIVAPPDHPCYVDHFPGDPIVPGALLIQWIISAIEENNGAVSVVAVSSIKFMRPVYPGDHCLLSIVKATSATSIELKKGEVTVLKGKLKVQQVVTDDGDE